MKIDINQFWNLLSESELVHVSQVQTLFSEFAAESGTSKTVESLTKWLTQKKAITPYQAEIIAAGHKGPFRFGNYAIQQKILQGPLKGHFTGRHAKTGFPILLQFLGGNEPSDLIRWKQTETLCSKIAGLEHPNLETTFESIVTPNYRFVVSQYPSGTSISEKIPYKARLPWKKACGIMAQTAFGLDVLHKAEIVHNAISPRTIWLHKAGRVQVRLNPFPDLEFDGQSLDAENSSKSPESQQDFWAPECYSASGDLTASTDIYAIGCLLTRLISGRHVFPAIGVDEKRRLHENEKPIGLKKYEVPDELDSLVLKMLSKDPANRPKTAAEVGNLLGLLAGKAGEIKSQKISISDSKKTYLNAIHQFLPGTENSVSIVPEIATEPEAVAFSPEEDAIASADRAARIQAAKDGAQSRKKGRWKIPAAVAASLLALSTVIGLFALSANNTTVKKMESKTVPDQSDVAEPIGDATQRPKNVLAELAALPLGERPRIFQELIEDDGEALWESPTTGPPVDFSFLPVAPKVLFHFRPSELVNQLEGQLLMKSFGPDFESRIQQFTSESGLDLEFIEQLTISLHSNESLEYESYFVVQTNKEVELDRVLQLWNRPALRTLENQQKIYESRAGDLAFYVLHSPSQEPPGSEIAAPENTNSEPVENPDGNSAEAETSPQSAETVRRFAFGSKRSIEEVAQSAGANVLSGSLRTLAEQTDRNRHFNMLWLRSALFNDEGQKLMGESRSSFNRQLSIVTPDDVRGGLMSLHLEEGTYFEMSLDRNFDLKAADLKDVLVGEFKSRLDILTSFVAQIPSSPYWDKVRLKYDNMLTDLNRNLRWDVEYGAVVANCWLPPMAAHNLIAASDLVIAFSAGAATTQVSTKNTPQSIEELLAIKRDLNIANPPDLNVLLAELQTEVLDDSGKLPFSFKIRLLGGDLEKEGITKNQRPSELVLEQKSLSDILTSIMTKANPDKDISGPSDPNCKLIWVIADDPDNPGQKAILVTTRAAAAEKSYMLPKAFRNE